MRDDRIDFSPSAHETAQASDADILVEITAGLSGGAELGPLLDRFLDSVVRLSGAQAGAARVLSRDGQQFQLVSEFGLPASLSSRERTVERHCGHCGAAADTRQLRWVTDLGACSAHTGFDFPGHGFQRLLAVPMQHRGRVLGVYNLFFAAGAEPAPQVMALLKSVGELLGLALDNARLESENLRAKVLHERQVMAAEVHDSVAQTLTFVKLRLPLLQDAVLAHDDARAVKYLADVRQAVGEAHASLREILSDLRTRIDPRGLSRALDALVDRFRERTAIELSHVRQGAALSLSSEAETEVFHIVHEALANIERHSRARHAWLHVEGRPIGFELRIEDDGVGPAAIDEQCDEGAHFGLGIMSERAQRIGGALSVLPRPGGGTLVRLVCPATGVPGARP